MNKRSYKLFKYIDACLALQMRGILDNPDFVNQASIPHAWFRIHRTKNGVLNLWHFLMFPCSCPPSGPQAVHFKFQVHLMSGLNTHNGTIVWCAGNLWPCLSSKGMACREKIQVCSAWNTNAITKCVGLCGLKQLNTHLWQLIGQLQDQSFLVRNANLLSMHYFWTLQQPMTCSHCHKHPKSDLNCLYRFIQPHSLTVVIQSLFFDFKIVSNRNVTTKIVLDWKTLTSWRKVIEKRDSRFGREAIRSYNTSCSENSQVILHTWRVWRTKLNPKLCCTSRIGRQSRVSSDVQAIIFRKQYRHLNLLKRACVCRLIMEQLCNRCWVKNWITTNKICLATCLSNMKSIYAQIKSRNKSHETHE